MYAYVSRGLIGREKLDGRTSTFDAAEVDALRDRHQRRRGGKLDVPIATALTRIEDGTLSYRGHDATDLAMSGTPYEAVAELLWTGTIAAAPRWEPTFVAAGESLKPLDAFRVTTAKAAAADELRYDLRGDAVARIGAGLIASVAAGPSPIPARLWELLANRPADPSELRQMNAAMVLLADHGLAAATLAARVAASVRADPYAVVLTGLGVISGTLHGGASPTVHELLLRAERDGPQRALGEALRLAQGVPGFGHPLYPQGDPRATALLELIGGDERRLDIVAEVITLAEGRIPPPNIDLAVAALTFANHLPAHAGEAIFALARTAGWVAHAIEEYEEAPVRFRPRARYVGVR